MASQPDPAAIWPGLSLAVESRLPDVRRDALSALAWRGNETALKAIVHALRRECDVPTAREGVTALVRRGGRPALATLIEALACKNELVKAEIIEGLKSMTGQLHGDAESWQAWWKTNKLRKPLP